MQTAWCVCVCVGDGEGDLLRESRVLKERGVERMQGQNYEMFSPITITIY
jgi:hypothetical protein